MLAFEEIGPTSSRVSTKPVKWPDVEARASEILWQSYATQSRNA
jgi:hypothetical protein